MLHLSSHHRHRSWLRPLGSSYGRIEGLVSILTGLGILSYGVFSFFRGDRWRRTTGFPGTFLGGGQNSEEGEVHADGDLSADSAPVGGQRWSGRCLSVGQVWKWVEVVISLKL